MDVRGAVSLVARYAAGPHEWNKLVVFGDGSVTASGMTSGARVPCPSPGEIAVEASRLKAMLGAIGGDAKLTLKKPKAQARRLEVAGGGSTFKLQEVALERPEPPAIPGDGDGWRVVPARVVDALVALSTVASREENDALRGLRLTPSSAIAGQHWGAMVVSPAEPLVSEPVTIDEATLSDLGGEDIELAIKAGWLFVDTDDAGVRWSSSFSADFPDGSIADALRTAAASKPSATAEFAAAEFAVVCKQAGVSAESPAEVFRMTIGNGKLTVASRVAGPSEFVGSLEATTEGEGALGMTPSTYALVVAAVARAGASDKVRLRFVETLIHFAPVNDGSDGVRVDAVVMPQRLD